jgi:hypothetical protein
VATAQNQNKDARDDDAEAQSEDDKALRLASSRKMQQKWRLH